MNTNPIKRHEALKPLSREHHHGLLLCWKIREGFRRNIEIDRIKRYTDWFWHHHLTHHFAAEEKFIFSILPPGNDLTRKALAEHRRLKRLFEDDQDTFRSLSLIDEELERHIRFEERVLFNEVQRVATPEQLQAIKTHPADLAFDDWEDVFWE